MCPKQQKQQTPAQAAPIPTGVVDNSVKVDDKPKTIGTAARKTRSASAGLGL